MLEIIGNTGKHGKVLGHIGKMFAGTGRARHYTKYELPENVITRLNAMVNKDGEIVPFHEPVDTTVGMGIKDRLKVEASQGSNAFHFSTASRGGCIRGCP